MRQPPTRAVAGAFLLAAAAAAGAFVAGAFPTPAAAQARGGAIEYGELTIVGNDGILWVRGESFFLEGPETRTPVKAQGSKGVSSIVPARILHLNTLGAAGWEFVDQMPGQTESYLLQRRL